MALALHWEKPDYSLSDLSCASSRRPCPTRGSGLRPLGPCRGISSATYTRQSSASRPIVVMTLPTWITLASLGDHLRLLGLLRRIDLCVEAIMVVLHAIDCLVGLSTLLLRSVLSKIGHSLVAACGE